MFPVFITTNKKQWQDSSRFQNKILVIYVKGGGWKNTSEKNWAWKKAAYDDL